MNHNNAATLFYDNFLGKLSSDFISGNPRTESAILFACRQLNKFSPKHVLDLGFGLGWSSYEFSKTLPGARVLGIDLSPELTKIASLMFGKEAQIEFKCQDLTDVEWSSQCTNRYGACVMLDVYEHVPLSERSSLHRALSAILDPDAVLILSCPTPLHQKYLREFSPEGLQPIDEDVTVDDLVALASDLNAKLIHLEHQSVWKTNDYFHAVIARNISRHELVRVEEHSLLPKKKRLAFLAKAKSVLGADIVHQLNRISPTLLRRVIDRLS